MVKMKCVLELGLIRAEADRIYEEEQKVLDQAAKVSFVNATKRAINYCEEVIGKHFEEQAQNRMDIDFEVRGELKRDRLGNYTITLLEFDCYYSNGIKAYKPIGDTLALEPLKEYLKQFCFSVQEIQDTYKRYGFGEKKCIKIKVGI